MHKKSLAPKIFMVVVILLLYLPIVCVAVYSFNDNPSRFTHSFTGFSFRHYQELFRDTKGLLKALWQSLVLAFYSCSVSAVIGVLGAVGMTRRKLKVFGMVESMSMLPIMIPEIILAMAFLAVYSSVGMPLGMGTMVLSHVTFCIPYIFIVVKGRLAAMDPSIAEAARDLGAGPARAFCDVTLPLILPGLVSGLLLAFAMSLDDFVISFFVVGNAPTLPIKIYSSVKNGVPLQVNALSTLMIGTVAIFTALFRLVRKSKRPKEGIA